MNLIFLFEIAVESCWSLSLINNFQQLFQKEKLNSSKSDDIAEFGVYFNNSAIKSVADSAIETEVEVEDITLMLM